MENPGSGPARPSDRLAAIVAAHAVLHTVAHVLDVSSDLDDARGQVARLLELVRERANAEHVPAAMLREGGRELLTELL
jgi:hypothetical protein